MAITEQFKKYELTDKTIIVNGHTLHQIRAIRRFNGVIVGDLGGFIESERNLSHEGDCWIYNEAKVFGNAEVFDNATVFGNAEVFDNAKITNFAMVFGNAKVYGNSTVCGHANIF